MSIWLKLFVMIVVLVFDFKDHDAFDAAQERL